MQVWKWIKYIPCYCHDRHWRFKVLTNLWGHSWSGPSKIRFALEHLLKIWTRWPPVFPWMTVSAGVIRNSLAWLKQLQIKIVINTPKGMMLWTVALCVSGWPEGTSLLNFATSLKTRLDFGWEEVLEPRNKIKSRSGRLRRQSSEFLYSELNVLLRQPPHIPRVYLGT